MAALSAQARLKLDAHRLWPLDVDADSAQRIRDNENQGLAGAGAGMDAVAG